MSSVTRYSIKWSLTLATTILLGNSVLAYADENTSSGMTSQSQPMETQSIANGTVARAIFTSQIADREPVDSLTELANDTQRIYFFTDLRGLTGQIITHQWEYAGKVMAEVKFKVGGGPRWRVYSSKNLLPEWTGDWTVSVIDENGSTLNASTFSYVPASSQAEPSQESATTTNQ